MGIWVTILKKGGRQWLREIGGNSWKIGSKIGGKSIQKSFSPKLFGKGKFLCPSYFALGPKISWHRKIYLGIKVPQKL